MDKMIILQMAVATNDPGMALVLGEVERLTTIVTPRDIHTCAPS